MTEDSSMYDDRKLEEVSAEQQMMLEGLSSYQDQKKYEVAEWRSRYKEHKEKDKLKKELEERNCG